MYLFCIFTCSVKPEAMADDWPDRWKHVQKLLERTGPFAEADFEPSSEVTLSNIFLPY